MIRIDLKKLKKNQTNYVLGLAGASGAGKSYIANKLSKQISVSSTLISQDNYYLSRDDLTLKQRNQLNYDHPKSVDFNLLTHHIKKLKAGNEIKSPLFSFKNHLRKKSTRKIVPVEIIILEGILIFTHYQLRSLIDYKIFIDTPADICFIRRLKRDMKERNRDLDSIINQYLKSVRPMYSEYVKPSKQYADCIFRYEQSPDHLFGQINAVLTENGIIKEHPDRKTS
jgi:uridine kinase